MNLLDQLKKQAAQVQEQTLSRAEQTKENASRVDDALRRTFHYLHELSEQIKIIKPTNPHSYLMFGVAELRSLTLSECYANYRMTRLENADYFDHITMGLTWSTSGNVVVNRKSATEVKQLEDFLWRANIKFDFKETRDGNGQINGGVFTFPRMVSTYFKAAGQHEQGMINISVRNLNGFNNHNFILPASEMNQDYIEELAKALIGATRTLRIPAMAAMGIADGVKSEVTGAASR
jgi:hypothetical protein